MNIDRFWDILLHIDLFQCFTKSELLSLFTINSYIIKNYNKNSVIYFPNEKCSTFDIILNGEVIVQKIEPTGNILTIAEFTAGNGFGENLIFARDNSYPMHITCKSDCIILHISKDLVLELCRLNNNFLMLFMQALSDKTLIITNKIKNITMKTIRQCIIDFLIYEYYYQKSTKILLTMSKKEMAERLGIQRPSLSRELNKMRKDNLIEFDSKSITIKNLDMLKNS
ncbi:cAMP-binding protein [Clostridium butyricum]|uniref:Helix-turn-helix domain-containing protein n=1 Tax=Clostridium butyricum TaxID=1492 RepID=A0A512TNA9_CLOBU|nr:Crp/Fnr family transcriptional regulator [Clostridium butyricum]NAS19876.1 helix-turn-helix domain-containing protein [Clostridium butyricum]NOW22720.1 CRP-like cAMP-binding protein [Clostridium butyricum]GEQ21744.1 cAMP-binding protein [Clostridium butyricum]